MEYKEIPLGMVKPSPMNPRKTFDDEAVKELAANIERQGLLQPITVRPCEYEDFADESTGEVISIPIGYEIVCGERRYRAFALLKSREDAQGSQGRFQSIPTFVREMSDEDAFEAMITENLQRQDVDPMEEAFAFGQLIGKGKTAEELALKFGKSIRFIQDRCKLNALIPELKVAVKDGKMGIAAAMLISKLDDDVQQKYYSSYSNNYQGFTKDTADSFVRSLFMSIDGAPWYQSDNQADEDFEGGCGCKCSECKLNTANHGCLFWEMKTEDAGRCTDRKKFYQKHVAFLLSILENYSDRLIKVGSPLESGKIVIVDDDEYCTATTKELKKVTYAAIRDKGYEIIKANEIFMGKCYYTDERLARKKEQGKVYCCLRLFSYDRVQLSKEWRYFKGGSGDDDALASSTPASSQQSADAMKLIQKRNRAKEIAIEEVTAKSRQFASDLGEAKRRGEISDVEQLAFDIIIFTLCGSEMLKRYGHDTYGKPSDRKYIDIIKQNQADRPMWMREFIRNIISSADITYNRLYQFCANAVLSEWMPKQYPEIVRDISVKLDKKLAKIDEKLKELGYDSNGKLLPGK